MVSVASHQFADSSTLLPCIPRTSRMTLQAPPRASMRDSISFDTCHTYSSSSRKQVFYTGDIYISRAQHIDMEIGIFLQ